MQARQVATPGKCRAAENTRKAHKGGKVEKMYDKLEEKMNALYERLDNLEGCEDNPVYMDEIETIRAELSELIAHIETEFF